MGLDGGLFYPPGGWRFILEPLQGPEKEILTRRYQLILYAK
jgi:hypothetical protein